VELLVRLEPVIVVHGGVPRRVHPIGVTMHTRHDTKLAPVREHVPILEWLPRYDRRWLATDALAGLSVWALLVPQSLA
jgi:hypothetical protein